MILLLPTLLTFVTLLIHRIRAARAAQRDRAPEEFVHRLPWRVWTGTGWEKHEGAADEDPTEDAASAPPRDPERGEGPHFAWRFGKRRDSQRPGANHDEHAEASEEEPEWVEHQEQCPICLDSFVKGDKVRVLPCQHMFHMDHVDPWLIQKKKTVCSCSFALFHGVSDTYLPISAPFVRQM